MPKVTLEFSLPDEQDAFNDAANGSRHLCVIEEFDNFLRNKLKYENLTEMEYTLYEDVRNKLRELRNDE